MMNLTQFLIFEVGASCNLSLEHTACPSFHRKHGTKTLTDKLILKLVKEAYLKLGFTGLIGWHFYNEPMIQHKRIFELMNKIRSKVPQSRFVLWTNGTIFTDDPTMQMFEQIHVTDYNPTNTVKFFKFPAFSIIGVGFDGRLTRTSEYNRVPCLRPFIELIINYYGDVHLCCQDWKNDVVIGNVFDTSLSELSNIKFNIVKKLCKEQMDQDAPMECLTCNGRIGLPSFDNDSYNRAFQTIELIRMGDIK